MARNNIKRKIGDDKKAITLYGTALVPLALIISKAEEAFISNYAAVNAAPAIASVIIKSAGIGFINKKLLICSTSGFAAVSILVTVIYLTSAFNSAQEPPSLQSEAPSVNKEIALLTPAPAEEEPTFEIAEENNQYANSYEGDILEINTPEPESVIQETEPPNFEEPVLETEPPPIEEPEPTPSSTPTTEPTPKPMPTQTPEPTPEPVIDRSLEILESLENAETEEEVNNIINHYNFSLFSQGSSSLGEISGFYFIKEGSIEIIIGTYKFSEENIFYMKYRSHPIGSLQLSTSDLINWLESDRMA